MASVPVQTITPTISVASKKQDDSPKQKKAVVKTAKAKKSNGERVTDSTELKPLKTVKQIEFAQGTFCYAQAVAVLTSRTVEEAKTKLKADKQNPTPKRRIEIRFLVNKGYVKTV